MPFDWTPFCISCFSNKGKTAYVYPAYELSRSFGLWPKWEPRPRS